MRSRVLRTFQAARPLTAGLLAAGLLTAGPLAAAAAAQTQQSGQDLAAFIKASYTKHEFRIPVRDGVRLFTAVYIPKDNSEKWPILLLRTPYSVAPYGVNNYRASLGPSERFAREKFIFAYQDVRGRHMSEGEFVNVRPHNPNKRSPREADESSDTYDTIAWLLEHIPSHNGRAGMWGISYPGFYTSAALPDAHPALRAASPQAPVTDWFLGDDFRHNGALYLVHAFQFLHFFGRPRPEPLRPDEVSPPVNPNRVDAYRFFLELGPLANINEKHFKNQVPFWNELLREDTYNQFWQARDIRRHLRRIKTAVLTVGGWFDAEDCFGALRTYEAIEKQNPGARNNLVMGPWSHGAWAGGEGDALGFLRFHSATARFYRDEIEFPFFNYHLKDKGAAELPEAYAFETGVNTWRRFEAWPPTAGVERPLYLRAEGSLSWNPPGDATGFDEYVSDPNKPVPYIAGFKPGMTIEHMVEDQRFASSRTDVLTYKTGELEEDVSVAGPITAAIWVSTTGTDSDWVVKLIDVFPEDYPDPSPNPAGVTMGGYQQLVRGEAFRGRFRKSFEKPEPFTPGRMEKIEFTLPDICHSFRRGHRIMVQIQSSWFPLVDRNPQTYVKIAEARAADFVKATQRVYRGKAAPSSVRLRVMPKR